MIDKLKVEIISVKSKQKDKKLAVYARVIYNISEQLKSIQAVMKEFVDNIKILINVLGYKVLEPLALMVSSSTISDDEMFYVILGSVNAIRKVTSEGFVVFAGATNNEKASAKSLSSGMKKL